jgi:hypothetical protein
MAGTTAIPGTPVTTWAQAGAGMSETIGSHQLINFRGTSWTNYYERQKYVKIFAINP